MIPYLVLLFVALGTAYLGRRYGSSGVRLISVVLVAALLVLFAGLRNRSVGTDTGNYVSWLDVITSVEAALTFPVELGYSLLVLISGWLSDGYALLLLLTATIIVCLYVSTIFRLARRYEIALFAFITLGFYTFFFNGARQGVAAAICFFALPWLIERKAIPYFALVAFATLFHKTALVAAPLYFIAASRVGWREMAFIVAGVVLMTGFLSAFTQFAASFIDEKYATYGQAGEGGGGVKVTFLVGQGLLLLLFSKQVRDTSGFYARLLNIYLIGLIPALASVIGSVNPSGILRLTIYFSQTSILLWPIVILSFRNMKSRALISVGFLIVAIFHFVLTTSSFSGLTPYRINSELFQ
ncbi:EpsG family protein [Marinobacter nauticus]|uniref:EpsG family protein n=1 Tax=Marinobacter nauticus TaxID=2743 RepID=UPI001C942F4C|nr:EpsG family protein [Marinobacter nauticus]MBY6104733.1 EpsG family protein [Marinobacter nauticus]